MDASSDTPGPLGLLTRRRHVVDTTPAGRTALENADRALDSLEETVLAPLSPDERDTLRDLLARVLERASVPA
jgi:DNA-binding MarR family transcriptional regulator